MIDEFAESTVPDACHDIKNSTDSLGRLAGIMIMCAVACSDATVGVLARAMDKIHFAVL